MNRIFQRFNLRKHPHTGGVSKSLSSKKLIHPDQYIDQSLVSTSEKTLPNDEQQQLIQSLKCETTETDDTCTTILPIDSRLSNDDDASQSIIDIDSLHAYGISEHRDTTTSVTIEEPNQISGDSNECVDPIPLKDDDPIVLMALQASQKALQANPCNDDVAQTRKHDRHVSIQLDQSGNDLYEQGDIDQAFVKYTESLHMKRQSLIDQYNHVQHTKYTSDMERIATLASIATSINNVAYLQHIKGLASAQETLESYEMALQIKQEILGHDHLSVGKTLNNIASVHMIQQNYQQAATTFEQAREILQLHLGCHHLDVCTVTANLGDVHYNMKQWSRAVKEYRSALNTRWEILGPSDPKVIRLMEHIAELEMQIDQEKNAKDKTTSDRYVQVYGPIVKDVRKLQKELQRDIDYVDLLQSRMPIEMIKEKALVFRELREMKCGVDLSDLDTLYDSNTHDTNLSLEESDLDIQSILQQSSELTKFQTKLIENDLISRDDCPSDEDPKVDIQPILKQSSDVTTNQTEQIDNDDHLHKHDTMGCDTMATNTPSTGKHFSVVSPSPTNVVVPEYKFRTSPLQLTPNERQQALSSIKDKLANLRAKREVERLSSSLSSSSISNIVSPPTKIMI